MKIASMVALAIALSAHGAMAQVPTPTGALVSEISAWQKAARQPEFAEVWMQAANRKEKCELRFAGPEKAVSAKWVGSCANGRASGLGVSVWALSDTRKVISLEEYVGHRRDGNVTYGQIDMDSATGSTSINKGVAVDTSSRGERTRIARTDAGNLAIASYRASCAGGECVSLALDLTGSTTYFVAAADGKSYKFGVADIRSDAGLLLTRRTVIITDILRADSITMDGVTATGVLDVTSSKSAPSTDWRLEALLDSARARYSAVEGDIDAAVREADEKFKLAASGVCAKPTDEDARKACNPLALVPSVQDVAAARAEIRHKNQAFAAQVRNVRAQNIALARTAANQELVAVQARQAAEVEAAQQGLHALQQAGQSAQQSAQQLTKSFQAPQVQLVAPHSSGVVHCRTVGYIEYCY